MEKTAIKVSTVSIYGNVFLSILKLFAGILAHSQAMISDAIHSVSDVFSSIIVIIGVKIASKESDDDHQYGHERMESVAAILLAFVLCMTGLLIGKEAFETILYKKYNALQIPGILALIAAIVSIVSKEGMYWYTRYYAKQIDSSALMADAWHHRSDALSSIGSLMGIIGARCGYVWFDALASIIICIFILKASYDIFMDSINKMVDHACSEELQDEIYACALKQNQVLGISSLKTRQFGNRIYVDIVVFANGNMTLFESDEIAENVHTRVEKQFPKIKHISVKVIPQKETSVA